MTRSPDSARLPAALLAALLSAALSAAPSARAADPAPKYRSAQEIIGASAPADWRPLDPADTLYLELPAGRVVIELAPSFAPAHVANIRTLAHEGYWNGLSINRSQDNFVVQWGDAEEDEAKKRPLGTARVHLPAEFSRPREAKDGAPRFTALPDRDGWAPQAGFAGGFPAARDPRTGETWLAHCYGTVGAGRDTPADSSNGTELYVVTGQSPRQLDRNITTVGRVVQGMELLSTLPRGTGPLGFYETAAERTPIRAIRLASDVPAGERTPLEVMRTDSRAFADMVEARRNRRDEWYKRPAGHIDVCNVPVPVRAPAAEAGG